jgi:aryl-alcohol dehydrogenase-like predicted oxidoreductase
MPDDRNITRRDALKVGVTAGALLALDRVPAFALSPSWSTSGQAALPLIERAIPSTGEKVPVIGMGTARNYERPTPDMIPTLRAVLEKFPELGGKVLDTAPAYGRAEEVVGDALAELKNRDRYFLATKVSVGRGGGGDAGAAAAQMEQSLKRLRTSTIDLMQIWNVSSPDVIVPVLNEWKAAKRIRYTGITSSSKGQYPALEAAMKAHQLDFVQVDYAIDNRSAAERIIPLAAERGMGVLINLPFGRSRVFQRVLGKPLPDWAAEFDATSWAQVFLKYLASNPAVTCVIPGTETIAYATDNNNAGRGRLPDAAMRKRIEAYFDALAS